MFTLFPNTTSPASALIAQHGTMILIGLLSLVTIAVAVAFGKPGNDGGYGGDFSSAGDCHDGGSDGGDCSGD